MTAPFVIHANLDCEARWAGHALPGRVAARVSYYAALLAALAPSDRAVEVWAPAAIDPRRLRAAPGWTPPAMRVGVPPRADLAWARDDARAVNDRRLALAVAAARGRALPGARVITDAGALAGERGRWVSKAPWTTAGRDRCHGDGPPTPEQRTHLARLLARFGALVVEPWMERIVDAGACASVTADGALTAAPPHQLVTDARGSFLGIDLAPPALTDDERAELAAAVRAAGAALAAAGYAGPFAVDAFAYRDGDARGFQALCEINARYTFGWIARALHQRLGTPRLGFAAPPAEATVLIEPADDGVTAWIA